MSSRILWLLAALLCLAACAPASAPTQSATAVTISLRFEPDPPTVGEGLVVIGLQTAAGAAIDNARLTVEGNMAHAGMMPVSREITTGENGEYRTTFDWSMGGEWVLTVRAELSSGETVSEDFNVSVGAISSESVINQRTPEATPEATMQMQGG
ncbi:MAG: FixH family protein [Chloroflexi bacterium]|nr:FixH family protein [Chloroflexota bacterium]